MIRNPYVAGAFYPGTAAQLKKALAGYIDKNAVKEDVIGLLVPHAGYMYSGPVAGAAISRVRMKDTFIIIGPSHSGLGEPFSVMTEGTWKTPLGNVEIDAELAGKLATGSKYLKQDTEAHAQEHAIEVQLPFLQFFKPDVRIVPIILAGDGPEIYEQIGREIAAAVAESKKEVVIMASGDMTHYEPPETARQKDMSAVEAMLKLDAAELTRRYKTQHITMCAYGPVAVVMTAAKELGATAGELVKYANSGDAGGFDENRGVVGYAGVIFKKTSLHPLVALAKATVEKYTLEGRIPPPPKTPTPEMKQKAGAFVSIHKKDGSLRGCIGTCEPQQRNVAEEIMVNAVSAATQDPRFNPVTAGELGDLEYSVDVLTTPELVKDESQLDPKKYGVIVECGWRRGLLLPDLEGVTSCTDQINICCQKGGISPDEPKKLYRFEVKRYH